MKQYIIGAIIILSVLFSFPLTAADVGIGISPSKIIMSGVSGQVQETEILVFNTGDQTLKISMQAEGEIAAFTTFTTENVEVNPEPQPHELPIKNGKMVKIRFNPPPSGTEKIYTGSIVASGGPGEGAQFGGTVGVASQVIFTATPAQSVFNFVTRQHILIAATALVIVLMFIILKKKGLKLSFKKQE
ncbi:MAG: hypothetical protein AABX72_04000 [Nanoarchaeota archaeon]